MTEKERLLAASIFSVVGFLAAGLPGILTLLSVYKKVREKSNKK